ncbi:MAG: hypothetical protein NUV82_02565 [Candidatus Komeilibacteria bacterium]|nr:hypothetical protein [Candidatus Komeilibacteria bacterium]
MSNNRHFTAIFITLVTILVVIIVYIMTVSEADNIAINTSALSKATGVRATLGWLDDEGSVFRWEIMNDEVTEPQVLFSDESALKYRVASRVNHSRSEILTIAVMNEMGDGQNLRLYDLITGDISDIFTLPNRTSGQYDRYINSAVYLPNRKIIGYSTYLWDKEKEQARGLEVWEYDLDRGISTLMADISGGIMSRAEVVGYTADAKNMVIYNYVADGNGLAAGEMSLLQRQNKVYSGTAWENAREKFQTNLKGSGNGVFGYPYISPAGDVIAFVYSNIDIENNSVLLYNLTTGTIREISVIEGKTGILPIWQDAWLFISQGNAVETYNLLTNKKKYLLSVPNLEDYMLTVATDVGVVVEKDDEFQLYLTGTESQITLPSSFNYEYLYLTK